jgi:hypothetical protein
MAGEKAMAPKRRWPMSMIVLAVASALATVGIVWLAFNASGQMPEWVKSAAGSPLALKCLVVIAVGSVLLAGVVIVLLSARRRSGARFGGFHGDQGGSAALEMALLFPFALIIFLTIIQAALLFNANMVVHYSAFAAARTATTIVPMRILVGDPLRDEVQNRVNPPEVQPSRKLEMIRKAAVLALVPISATLTTGGTDADGATVQERSIAAFAQFGKPDMGWFGRIKQNYDYADAYTKIELTKPEHWLDGDPDHPDCPNSGLHTTDNWVNGAYVQVPWCNWYHRIPMQWDYWYWEDLKLEVTYSFLLEVPYASRLMGEATSLPDRTGTQYISTIKAKVALTNEGGPELPLR